jgi:arylsulfatase A-like enzyme
MSGGKAGGPPRGILDRHAGNELARLLTHRGYRCGYAGKWHVGTWGPTESLTGGEDTGFENLCPIHDGKVPQTVARFVREVGKEPWMCVASFDNPHNIHEWAVDASLPWGNLPAPPALRDLPPLPANFAPSPDEPRAIRDLRNRDSRLPETPEQWRRYRWAYFRLVEKVDRQVGLLMEKLNEAGMSENTLVIFTSDHGDMNAAHRLAFKHVLYQESISVPLILAGPGIEHRVEERFVSAGLDIYPTILSAAGVGIPSEAQGVSLLDWARDSGQTPDRAFIVCQSHVGGRPARMLRTQRWKYVLHEQGPLREQLFDMENDPGEQVNLATCAAMDDVLREHRRLLLDWMRQADERFGGGHYTHPDVDRMLPGMEYPGQ